jgi:hypothetical protein
MNDDIKVDRSIVPITRMGQLQSPSIWTQQRTIRYLSMVS